MGSLSIWHIILLLAVVLLIFGGGGKIPKLMKDMGQGITAFKRGLKEEPKPGEPALPPALNRRRRVRIHKIH